MQLEVIIPRSRTRHNVHLPECRPIGISLTRRFGPEKMAAFYTRSETLDEEMAGRIEAARRADTLRKHAPDGLWRTR
jgi:hypothetical protein